MGEEDGHERPIENAAVISNVSASVSVSKRLGLDLLENKDQRAKGAGIQQTLGL